MPKWKRGAIFFMAIDIFAILITLYDYYEVFIKKCRDMFPFGHCPWGWESMGEAWSNSEVYLNGVINTCCVHAIFLLIAFFAFFKKKYGIALCSALGPIIVFRVRDLVEYLINA